MKEEISQIHVLIARNKINNAFESIQRIDCDVDEVNSITMLSSRFFELESKKIKGLIVEKKYNTEISQIKESLLKILENMESKLTSENEPNQPKENEPKDVINKITMKGKYVAGNNIYINKKND